MPDLALDVTNALIATVASELARVQGGALESHWQEAAQLVERLATQQTVGPCMPDSMGLRDGLSGVASGPDSPALDTLPHDPLGPQRFGRGQVPRRPFGGELE